VDVEKCVDRISSANLSNESYVRNFENKFSKYIKAPYSISTDMGRTALLLGLKTLGIGNADEVIVPSYIWAGIMDPILEVSAKPILVDSQIEDFNISPSEISKNITMKTKAIMVHNHNGLPCNIHEISTIARDNNCYLIEDCAHAIGAKYGGKNIGTFGDISFFSFHHDKPIACAQSSIK
jgi:dTDP-4-amino-4,6-dideoxygalactose transaminase